MPSRLIRMVSPMPPGPLANAELSVLELLWDHGDMTARHVQDRLYGHCSHHGAVQRLLQRLEGKGFVRRDRAGAAQTFAPCLSR